MKGRHGKYFYGMRYKEREIEVQVRLTGVSNVAMRRQYERLNRLLFSSEPQLLVFGDDPERGYKCCI